MISFKLFRETLRQPRHPAPRGARRSTSNTSTARSSTCATTGSSTPRGPNRLRGRLLRRLRVPLGDPAEADRAGVQRGDAADRARLRAPRRGALRRARRAPEARGRARSRRCAGAPRRARAAPKARCSAVTPRGEATANQTRPSGLASEPPGPATPVIATARSTSDVPPRALGHRPRHRLGDGAVLGEHRLGHAEHRGLGRVGIGDEAAVEDVRGAGDVGQRRADQAAGAAFGGGDAPARARGPPSSTARARASAIMRSHPCAIAASAATHDGGHARPAMTSSSITPVGPLRRSAQPTGPGLPASNSRNSRKAATQPGQGKTCAAAPACQSPSDSGQSAIHWPTTSSMTIAPRVEVVLLEGLDPARPVSERVERQRRQREQRKAAEPVQQPGERDRRRRAPGAGRAGRKPM